MLTGPRMWICRPSWYQGKVAEAYGVAARSAPLAEP